jgi:hypothetical protein
MSASVSRPAEQTGRRGACGGCRPEAMARPSTRLARQRIMIMRYIRDKAMKLA